jgi:hypothetical protein
MAASPAAQAASVVLVAMRPMPSKSIAESVLPGLKPYQPNHRMKPPTVAIVRSCGSIGPPPSRLKRRPSRGPSTIAPAKATNPPMLCTTVEPAKSWKPVPSDAKKLPSFARRSVSAHRESVLADPKARSKAAFDVTSAPRIADGILPNE